jgi:sugar phosphate isomerase/epimerase
MIKAISTYVYVKERLHPGMLDGLKRAGAEAIEIFGARNHFDYTDRQHVKEVADWFKTNGIPMNSLHAPMFADYEWGRTGAPPVNIVDREKRRRVESMDEIKRAIEAAELVPFRFLVQHLGTPNEAFEPEKFEHGLSSLEHLHAFARPLGVKILLENIPNEMATPEKLIEFLNTLHYDDMGIIFDVGHAHVMSSIPEAFELLKTRIRSTHIHDNNKDRDAHLWPGKGSINWPETLGLLRTAPHVPPLVLEINGENQENILGKYEEAFRTLEQAENAPAG